MIHDYSDHVSQSRYVLLLWIRLKKKTILLNLKLKLMKSNNIWKIVIGAISAALGYILNAIGL